MPAPCDGASAFGHSRVFVVAAAATLLFSTGASAQRIERIGPLIDTAVPEALRSSLEPQGVGVSLAEGSFCELWLRKSIPAEKNGRPGALHTDFGVSTAVGVIRFVHAATDFRGQAIRPGLYTLRYALLPSDGDHLGVSEYPDFLLLAPAAEDPSLDAKFKFEDLVGLSRKATGTKHPGVLCLTQPSGTDFPSVNTNEKGHVVLQLKARLSTGADVPIALVVKGRAEQ